MDGELKKVRELWARHLSDEGITANEESFLRETLLNNDDARNLVMADDSIHRSLHALSITDEDEDSFVDAVMSKVVETHQSTRQPVPPPPPIAEAPYQAAVVQPLANTAPQIRHEPRRRRKNDLMRARQVSPLVAASALVVFFGLGSLVGFVLSDRSQVADRTRMAAPIAATERRPEQRGERRPEQRGERANPTRTPRAIPDFSDPGVGTLVSSRFGSWDRPRAEGSRLQPGQFRLERGEAEIELDSGTLVRLVGPAEFKLDSPRELEIQRGTLAAVVPRSAGEVRLQTPTSNVIGQIATIELAVNRDGASDVFVHDGEVTVEPWANSANGQPLVLTSTDVNRATVWKPSDSDPRSPLAMASQTNSGQFSGRISVNGREMDFDSPEAFETVRQRVEKQFRDSVEQLERDWTSVVRTFAGGKANGEVNLNGVRMGFENFDDVIQLQRKLMDAAAKFSDGNTANSGAFQGMININGEVRKFSSIEEFEKARREAFGPLQGLNLDGMDKLNVPNMFNQAPKLEQPQGNPFLPKQNGKPAKEINLPVKDKLNWKEV